MDSYDHAAVLATVLQFSTFEVTLLVAARTDSSATAGELRRACNIYTVHLVSYVLGWKTLHPSCWIRYCTHSLSGISIAKTIVAFFEALVPFSQKPIDPESVHTGPNDVRCLVQTKPREIPLLTYGLFIPF